MLWPAESVVPEGSGWIIAPATPSDVLELASLTEAGSTLRVDLALRYPNKETWRTLVAGENVVCARNERHRLVGLYAVNVLPAVFLGSELREARRALNKLSNRLKLADAAIGFGTLSCIATECQQSDLRLQLLRALLRMVGYRYRYLFDRVLKIDDAEIRWHSIEGWRCFHEEDEPSYLMLDAARALRLLASRLTLRSPLPSPSGPNGSLSSTTKP
jgi:hypothetical protein